MISAKPLRIRFDKINGFIKIYDRIRYLGYLVLFGHMWYDEMCNRIRYNLKKRLQIVLILLPTEKLLNFHNIIILNKSVVNKNENNYYFNTFLEKV